jgi:hypothetical protein
VGIAHLIFCLTFMVIKRLIAIRFVGSSLGISGDKLVVKAISRSPARSNLIPTNSKTYMNNLKSYLSILASTFFLSLVGLIASANAIDLANPSSNLFSAQTKDQKTELGLGQPISFVSTDWNGDGLEDMAVLITSETEPREPKATLLIYLSEAPDRLRLATRKENLVWHGSLYGNEAKLSLNDQGSLVISSQNDAIGRGRWNEKITAMYQNGTFIVAGYTYNYRDTLDLAAGGICDVNFLTRRGISNNNPFRIDRSPINLIDWTESAIPTECKY